MYELMVAFYPTRATPVTGGHNKDLDFGNVVSNSKGTGGGYPGSGGGAERKLGCWHCGGEHLKRNCPKRAKEKGKDKTQQDEGGEWGIRRSDNKRSDGKTEVKGG